MFRIFHSMHTLPSFSFGASQAPKKVMRSSMVPEIGASIRDIERIYSANKKKYGMEGKMLILSRMAHLPSSAQYGQHKVVEEIVGEYKLTSLVNYREKGRRNDNANVKRV